MKYRFILLLFLIPTLLSLDSPLSLSEAEEMDYLNTAQHVSYMTEREIEMVRELNLVRSHPKIYKELIQIELRKFQADSALLSRLVSKTTRERVYVLNGVEHREVKTESNNYYHNLVEATKDLLHDLEIVKPMGLLYPDPALSSIAISHAEDQASKPEIDHRGTDGLWPMERIKNSGFFSNGNENIAQGACSPRGIVIQLLIDSGVPGYGHRYNILNPDWKFVACHEQARGNSPCKSYWLQEFATD